MSWLYVNRHTAARCRMQSTAFSRCVIFGAPSWCRQRIVLTSSSSFRPALTGRRATQTEPTSDHATLQKKKHMPNRQQSKRSMYALWLWTLFGFQRGNGNLPPHGWSNFTVDGVQEVDADATESDLTSFFADDDRVPSDSCAYHVMSRHSIIYRENRARWSSDFKRHKTTSKPWPKAWAKMANLQ